MPILTDTYDTESFYIDSRGFLYLKFYRENNFTLKSINLLNEYLEVISNTCNETTASILVDLRDVFGIVTISEPCLRLLFKDIRLMTVCNKIAFITNSPPLSSTINNYIEMYSPKVLTKVYNDIDDGIGLCEN
jgi:hypothetical protein